MNSKTFDISQQYKQNPQRNFYKTDLSNIFIKDFDISIPNLTESMFPFVRSGFNPGHRFNNNNILIYDTFYTDSSTGECTAWRDDCPSFIKDMYDLAVFYFKELDSDLEIEKILRVNVNCTVNDLTMKAPDIHQDHYYFRNVWGAIVHLSGDSGETVFYDTLIVKNKLKSIDFKPGRIIIYPAIYPHQGLLPTSANPRFVLSIVFKVKTYLNHQIPYKE